MKDTIILSGGGLLGFCTLGALDTLFYEYKVTNIKRIVGSSVGALIGFLLCIKKPCEIYDILNNNNLFNESNIDFLDYLNDFGFVKHDLVKDELSKFFPVDLTFSELFRTTNVDFCIYGTNLSTMKSELFSNKTTPSMKVIEAVCISISIPFVFKKYVYNNQLYADSCITTTYETMWNLFKLNDEKKIGIVVNTVGPCSDINNVFDYSQRIIYSMLKVNLNKNVLNINVDYPMLIEYTTKDTEYLFNFGKNSAYNWIKKSK